MPTDAHRGVQDCRGKADIKEIVMDDLNLNLIHADDEVGIKAATLEPNTQTNEYRHLKGSTI